MNDYARTTAERLASAAKSLQESLAMGTPEMRAMALTNWITDFMRDPANNEAHCFMFGALTTMQIIYRGDPHAVETFLDMTAFGRTKVTEAARAFTAGRSA